MSGPRKPGDKVRLTSPMAVGRVRNAIVERVDGQDIYVRVVVCGAPVIAHRYACEMELR